MKFNLEPGLFRRFVSAPVNGFYSRPTREELIQIEAA